ncbi:MAG TPA: ParB/RepB/Spo0J family partition protein [Pyrinomonadaceae bacterium]|nr:ParB/RepB/Spo0J family partition protein [Pyrinomonadaceae bacterium]HNU07391.1 ParB/RepB/Spo0J family partition protein [Pyrinomonadaceae bacterium]
MARKALGRGLSALIKEDNMNPADSTGSLELDIDLIDPNPEQPRTRFAEENLEELAQSIRANGIVQPIVVRKKGARYEIVAGERRWRASQRAGLRKIPAVVKDVSDEKLLELALIENIQRQELNAIEEARAYRRLVDTIGLTQEMIAERVGKDRTLVATSLRLLKLPNDIQKLIEEQRLSAGHGRALLMAESADSQRRIARKVIEMALSVRETEKAVKRVSSVMSANKANKGVNASVDANIKAAETKLRRFLGTHVSIVPNPKGTGGKIRIEYYGDGDLSRIYELLMKS